MPDDNLFPMYRKSDMNQRLRDLFSKLGGNLPVRLLAEEAVARGVISPEVVESARARGLQEICRRALKVKTGDGVPFAKPVTDEQENTSWKQLLLYSYAEAVQLLAREANGVLVDYEELRELQKWCRRRFGTAPDIPELVEPGSGLN